MEDVAIDRAVALGSESHYEAEVGEWCATDADIIRAARETGLAPEMNAFGKVIGVEPPELIQAALKEPQPTSA
jgi:hypothetical protein